MTRIVLALFVILFAGALFVLDDSGFIQIRIASWKLETTVVIAATALLAALIVLRIVYKIITWPIRLNREWHGKKMKQQISLFSNGLVQYINGEYEDSYKTYQKITAQELQLPALLMSAQLAQTNGQYSKREDFIQKALQKFPNDRAMIQLIQTICLQKNGDIEPALQILRSLLEGGINTTSHWRRMSQILLAGHRWEALRDLLGQSKSTLPKEEWHQLKALLNTQEIKQTTDLKAFEKVMAKLEKPMLLEATVVEAICEYGSKYYWKGDYFHLITTSLKKKFDVRLVKSIRKIPIKDIHKALQYLQNLATKYENIDIHITIAVLAAKEEMWGIVEESRQKVQQMASNQETLFLSLLLDVLQDKDNQAKESLYAHLKHDYPQLLRHK